MCGSMVGIQSPIAEDRRGRKERKRKKETTAAKYNGLPYWAAIKPNESGIQITKKHETNKTSVILAKS